MADPRKILQYVNPMEWLPQKKQSVETIIKEVAVNQKGMMFLRLAGLSGAIAVGMGAYGAHVMKGQDISNERKLAFDTGNRYHLIHSVALLATPLARRPNLVGGLIALGMTLFCGSCYYHALTGNQRVRFVAPYGGMLLIAGWASMML